MDSNQNLAFRRFLLQLNDEILDDDLKKFKFILGGRDDIGTAAVAQCSSALDIFDLLQSRGLLSHSDTHTLRELLLGAKRIDLLGKFGNLYLYSEEDILKKVQKELRDGYMDRLSKMHPFPWCPWREIDLDHVFTNLEVLVGIKHRLPANTSPKMHTIEDVVECLWGDQRKKVGFVQGAAGIGKSTMCRQLVNLWATDTHKLKQHFKLVLILEGRNFTGDLSDCIFHQLFPEDTLKEDIVFDCVQKYASSCLIILDGIDELSGRGKAVALKLASRKLLKGVTLLLTGRPEAVKEFIQYTDRHLEIKGFTPENAASYIHKYFGLGECGPRDQLLKRINTDTVLGELVINPFTTLQLCLIAETDDGKIPTDTFDIMKEVVLITCARYISNIMDEGVYSDNGAIHPTSDDPGVTEDELFSAAEHVAYFSIKADTLVMSETKLLTAVTEPRICRHLLKSGILTRDFTLSRRCTTSTCWFPHKSIQEFLCASYLAPLAPEDLRTAIKPLPTDRCVVTYRGLISRIVDDEPRMSPVIDHIAQRADVELFCDAAERASRKEVMKLLAETLIGSRKLSNELFHYGLVTSNHRSDVLHKLFRTTALYPVIICGRVDKTISTIYWHTRFSEIGYDMWAIAKLTSPTEILFTPYRRQHLQGGTIPWVTCLSLDCALHFLSNWQPHAPTRDSMSALSTLSIVWIPDGYAHFIPSLEDPDHPGLFTRRARRRLPVLKQFLSRAQLNITLFIVVPILTHDDYCYLRVLDLLNCRELEHVRVQFCFNGTFRVTPVFLQETTEMEFEELGLIFPGFMKKNNVYPIFEFQTPMHRLYYEKFCPY